MNKKFEVLFGMILFLSFGNLYAVTPQFVQVSGGTAANGIYEKVGLHGYFNHEYWRRLDGAYYLYSDKWAAGGNGNFWNLDNDLDDENEYISYSVSSGGQGAEFNDALFATFTSPDIMEGWDSRNGAVTVTIYEALPEINITGNGITITDGDATPSSTDHTDFGSVLVSGGTISRTFTISNSGSATLTLGANAVSLSGGQSGDFTVTTQPESTVAAGGSTTFTIQFDPSASGTRNTTVNVNNDDSDENPYDFSIQGAGVYIAPTTQASTIAFSNVGAAAMTISWTNGNGSARAVFVYAGSSGSASPTANTTYTANTKFGLGTQIGATGWYCVYNGVGTSVDVTGFIPGTTYRAMVCEYNGNAGYEAYITSTVASNPANQSMYEVIINEVDADTPGDDTGQFIELFSPGSGNVSLDGLTIVLFNGETDVSYRSVDLDGYITDANGYFVYGNSPVSGVDLAVDNILLIQNGQDAVALYSANAVDFPNGTAITTTNLIDALVYDTGQADDAGLLVLLNGGEPQVNENGRGDKDHHSNQRLPNGTGGLRNTSTYDQQPPTPDAANYGYPEIVSATYDYNSNQLVVTGEYLVSNAGENNDVDVSTLTFTGEGGGTYTLSSTSDVEISSSTQFSLTLSGSDLQNVEYLLNKNGTSSADGTTYNFAAADNWMTGAPAVNDISDITSNGITVSNFTNPVITSSTYDVSTGQLVATGTNFIINPATNDIDASLFTFTGQGGGTYILTNTSDVEITSAIQFTLTLSAADKLGVAGLFNKNGTQSVSGTTYNLDAVDNWMTGSPAANNIADGTTGITVSNVPPPSITSATYNYSTNVLVVTSTDLIANGSGADIDVSMLTFTGQGGSTYTLSSSSDVEISSATEFNVALSGNDIPNVEALLNKNGTSSAGGTTYNLAAAEDWLTGFETAENIADLNGNEITVSNYSNPTITSAAYDASTGVLVVTGTNLVSKSGANNDINASFISIAGEGGNSYSLLNTSNVDLTSATSFTLTLNATDKLIVDGLLNKAGTISAGGQTYNIAGADDWNSGAYPAYYIQDLDNNAITVSNILTPTITSATYDSDSGIFVVTGTNLFKKYSTANDIDVSKFTVTGEGGTYTITSTTDVEITSSTEFTFTVTGSDKTQVDSRLDLFGTQSSGGTTYNLEAAEDWLTAADPSANIADLVGNGITVVVTPKITGATYNAATGVIVVTGTNIQANAGGADIDASKFTITGEGVQTYTLTDTPDVERSGSTQFTLTLSVTDWNAIAQIINKNGTTSTSGTTYNIAAADDWCTNVTASNTADLTGNGITASNVAVPTIASSTYNVSTGVLVVTGSRFVKMSGALNDIDVSKLTITGEGGATYNLANTADVEITSGTQFTVTLDEADRNAVNLIVNKNGTSSTSGTTYNLVAAEDWAVGADAAVNVVDATGNGITVSNVAVPVITSASYHWSNGVLTATGTGLTKKAGAANDIDASKFTFKGEGGASYTLAGSPDVEITSGTEFTITLDATDKTAINLLLNKPGTKSNDNTTYNLAAAEDWAAGADAAVNVVDATTPITAGNFNNPPTGGNDVVNMYEDSPHTFAVTDFTYNDADTDPFDGIQIQTIETAGELKYNGVDVTIGLDCPDVTKLVFTSPLNVNASPYATFTLKVKDDRGGYSIATYTMTINVLPVNDAPVISNIELPTINYQEGEPPVVLTNTITITDLDNVDMDGAVIEISSNYQLGEDELVFTNANGINGSWNPTSGRMTLNGISSIANYELALRTVSYQNLSSAPSTLMRTVSFTVNDGSDNSNTVSRNITVAGINDAPIVTVNAEQTIIEGETFTFTNLSLYTEDFDSPSSIIRYQLVETPKHGKILGINGMEVAAFTQDDIANGSVKYKHNGDETREDYFTFTVTDGEAVSTEQKFTFTITNKNDAPVISSIPEIVINEDETYTLNYESLYPYVTDPDNADSTLSFMVIRTCSNIEIMNEIEKGCSIYGAKNWNGVTELKLTVYDGEFFIESTIALTVNSVNDNPQLNGLLSNITFVNGDNYTINLYGLAEDVETPDSLLMFSIVSDQDSILTNYDNKTGIMIISALGKFHGTGNITVKVTDTDGGSSEETITISVTPQTTGITNITGIPEEYMLFQNYPNPFNPETMIDYALPEESIIRIVIYNILGQQIAVLIEGTKAAGYYKERWNASNLPSGIYFIKINAASINSRNNYLQIRKMLLLK